MIASTFLLHTGFLGWFMERLPHHESVSIGLRFLLSLPKRAGLIGEECVPCDGRRPKATAHGLAMHWLSLETRRCQLEIEMHCIVLPLPMIVLIKSEGNMR